MNAAIVPQDKVSPSHQPWAGLVKRVERGKALVAITELRLSAGLYRRLNQPILAWVPVVGLERW